METFKKFYCIFFFKYLPSEDFLKIQFYNSPIFIKVLVIYKGNFSLTQSQKYAPSKNQTQLK